MRYGFVYLLANSAMRGFYKIGCTERSPHQRALELSVSTGVPVPFDVICYIEVADFQRVEQSLHNHLSDFRVSQRREFFGFHRDSKPWLYGLFRHHPDLLAFTAVDLSYLYHEDDAINPWEGREVEDGPDLPRQAPAMSVSEVHENG